MPEIYADLCKRISDATTTAQLDHVIEDSYQEYLKDNITDEQYGKIYFACIRIINR